MNIFLGDMITKLKTSNKTKQYKFHTSAYSFTKLSKTKYGRGQSVSAI